MKKHKYLSLLFFLILVPGTLLLGSGFRGRWYYLTGTLMVAELLIPFFLAFEGRKPQARELAVLAVMCALAVAARVAIPLPHFKAVYAIIMIAGIAFGAESGFLVGAVSALASNFFYSQGPYTPWQMMAYGAAGLLAGFLFGRKRLNRTPLAMAAAGFFTVLLAVGPILDTCTLVLAPISINAQTVLTVYLSGLAVNVIQACSTAVTLFLLGRPLLDKLERMKLKYGILETPDE